MKAIFRCSPALHLDIDYTLNLLAGLRQGKPLMVEHLNIYNNMIHNSIELYHLVGQIKL